MEGESNVNPARSRLRGAAAVKAHVTLTLGLLLCAAAFWFEVGRALGGNELSWAYVFEWPLLAGFAVYMWWKVLHPDVAARPQRKPKKGLAPEYSGMLAAWEQHQSEVAAQRQRESGEAK